MILPGRLTLRIRMNVWRRAVGVHVALLLVAWVLAGCQAAGGGVSSAGNSQAFEVLGKMPLASEPWGFADAAGKMIKTPHYHIYTTVDDVLYQHLVVKVLEAAHERVMR